MDYSTYVLPFGKYKFTAIRRVPVEYLTHLYKDTTLMIKYPEVKQFIEEEMYHLLSILPSSQVCSLIPDPICNKQCYVDEGEALKALKLIKQDKRSHKKPIRAYLHSACGFWHLTSETLEEYEKRE